VGAAVVANSAGRNGVAAAPEADCGRRGDQPGRRVLRGDGMIAAFIMISGA